MTSGFEDGFGSARSSQVPTEGPDEERGLNPDVEEAVEAEESVPRHTKPFRAWGAAQDVGPSWWERLVAWMKGLFGRRSREGVGEVVNYDVNNVVNYDVNESVSDVVDEPVVAEEVVVEEVVVVEEPVVADEVPAAGIESSPIESSASTDAIWDEPVVTSAPSTETPTLAADDFADVWKPREESAVADEPAAEEPIIFESIEEEKKPGFFARLFSRKKKAPVSEQVEQTYQYDSGLTAPPADADFADDAAASVAPAEADFADETAASVAPAEGDFASEPIAASSPSLDHSAEDSASLAAFLASTPPLAQPEPEAPSVEEELPVVETVAEDVVDVSLTIDPVPEPEVLPPAEVLPTPEPEPKKAGFFSGLLKRVSRSQFVIPKRPSLEPVAEAPAIDEPVVEELAAEQPVIEEPVVEETVAEEVFVAEMAPVEERAAEFPSIEELAPPAPSDFDDLGSTVPTPMPAVPNPFAPPKAAEGELEATQPFPAFRDARDDFEPELDKGRATEKVEMPVDDGEKTDEFEIVPPVEATGDETAETRQVAGFIGRIFGKKVEEKAATSAETAAQAAEEDKTPFVLAKFRTFYNEVIRDKHQKSDVISGFATAVMGAPGASSENDPEFAAQLLSKRLSEMLELQAAESNWTGGDAAKYYPEAQYAMVALADETFATTDWAGRSSWHKYMLEPKMYGTRGADLEFFKRIDKLLKEAPNEKGARDLARLYLMVIASGFRGKYRVPNLRRPLAEYRRRLYEFSHQADPLDLYGKDRRLFPDAVEHTLESRAVGRFTAAQKWVAAVLILVVLYLGFSHFAWTRLSADLKDIMSRVQATDTVGKAP